MPAQSQREPRVVMAPDKLRGTLGAAQAATAMSRAASLRGWAADSCPLSDGGEGFAEVLACLGGSERTTSVTGPLGRPVDARWRLAGDLAVVESAAASGLELAGGAAGNRPLEATSRGTGELIAAAVAAGARRVLLGAGGSATTDGGRGALEALEEAGGARGAELVVACDVDIAFVDAAERFGPQKGAGPAQVSVLRRRLQELADHYRRRYGVDVTRLAGGGSAGGLAGGLAALGARLVPGFSVVAEAQRLERRLDGARLVMTAEGRLDSSSWAGKVVGRLTELTGRHGVALVVLAGSADAQGAAGANRRGVEVVDLEVRFGPARARDETATCLEEAAGEVLDQLSTPER